MYTCQYSRAGKSCKQKFDRLWNTPKPTGSTEPPRHVIRAQDIKHKIEVHECMGRSSANDSDDEDNDMSPIKGTNLLDDNGEFRRPLTKKRKTHDLLEGLEKLGEGQKEAAATLANALTNMTATMGTTESGKVDELATRINTMESKLDMILDKLS